METVVSGFSLRCSQVKGSKEVGKQKKDRISGWPRISQVFP